MIMIMILIMIMIIINKCSYKIHPSVKSMPSHKHTFMLSFEGLRPFGVSILYMGWDKHYGYQLYQSDPSGNYSGWKATCIGNNSVVSHFCAG